VSTIYESSITHLRFCTTDVLLDEVVHRSLTLALPTTSVGSQVIECFLSPSRADVLVAVACSNLVSLILSLCM
jgi:hypothetical protein